MENMVWATRYSKRGQIKMGGKCNMQEQGMCIHFSWLETLGSKFFFFFFGGATAQGGPWPPLQYASKSLDPSLCLSIRLFPSFSGPWTLRPAISFVVFLFVLLHTAFHTTSFLGLRCLAFFLCDQAIVFFGI